MKKQITRALIIVGMLFVLVASASAQTARRITVQIPFDFVAGQKHLPSGRYVVRAIVRDSEKMLLIRSEDGREQAAFTTNSAGGGESVGKARVSFRQYGERFFLAAVSLPGASSVRELPKSRDEKSLDRELREAAKAGDAAFKTVTLMGSVR
jgi:hypothetical protein